MTPWLATVLTVGFAMVLGLSLVLWRDLRNADRLSMRLRMVRHGAGSVEPESEEWLPPLLRMVTTIGEMAARSGVLSKRTLEDLRQTLHVAGFRGRHGLELFVGTKLLLVVGLPLATLAVASHFNSKPGLAKSQISLHGWAAGIQRRFQHQPVPFKADSQVMPNHE